MKLFDFFKNQSSKISFLQSANDKPAVKSKPKAESNSKETNTHKQETTTHKQETNAPTQATLRLASIGF